MAAAAPSTAPRARARARAAGRAAWPAEIHIPITPTASFFTRVHLLAASVRRSGGGLAGSRIVVTVSRDLVPVDLAAALPWSHDLQVEWRWMDAEPYDALDMYGTALQRMRYDFEAPLVVLLDADVVCAGPMDELATLAADGLAGVIAHVSPARARQRWRSGELPDGQQYWDALYEGAGLERAQSNFEHTGWGCMEDDATRRMCPPYFNLGMLAATADVMRGLGDVVLDEMEHVNRSLDTWFRCQLAVMLALGRTSTPAVALPMRWNFPNDPGFWSQYPGEAADVRVLHYLRRDEVDREQGLVGTAGVERLLGQQGLSPANLLLQRNVRELRDDLGAVVGLA